MRNVLFIAPTKREHESLPRFAEELDINLIWDDFVGDYFDDFLEDGAPQKNTLDIVKLTKDVIEKYRSGPVKLHGVTSAVGYPGMSVVAVIAQELGLPGPSPSVIMQCEHKYYSRVLQKRVVPDAVPEFLLVDPDNLSTVNEIGDVPRFLKPCKASMSMHAHRIDSHADLIRFASTSKMPERYTQPFDDLTNEWTDLEISCSKLVLEDYLPGHQVSLEGFVFDNKPVVMGIVDGEVFPGTRSFTRWLLPSRLPVEGLRRMEQIAVDFFGGIGYNNAMFNMELMYDPETSRVSIIEVNPKLASQFPDLFEKVDGMNSYKILLQIAVGDTPEFKRGNGEFEVAASCVLRTFEDRRVKRKPTQEDVEAVKAKYPDALIGLMGHEGKRLSEITQDTESFRYGLINIGAESIEALEAKNEDCKKMLRYEFE